MNTLVGPHRELIASACKNQVTYTETGSQIQRTRVRMVPLPTPPQGQNNAI